MRILLGVILWRAMSANIMCVVYVKILCVVCMQVRVACMQVCVMCMSKSCVRCILKRVWCVCRNLVWCACQYLVWCVCKNRARSERQNVLCARQNVCVYVKIRTSFSCYCYMRWNQCAWFKKMAQNQNLHSVTFFYYKNIAYKNIRLWWSKS